MFAGGVGLTAVSALGEVGGVALDAPGIGALVGAPANVLSAAGIAAGVGMMAAGMAWGKSRDVNKIAQDTDSSPKDVKDAIHKVKNQRGWRGDGKNRNPDVEVDEDGEVYPEGSDDSIGNIHDYLGKGKR